MCLCRKSLSVTLCVPPLPQAGEDKIHFPRPLAGEVARGTRDGEGL